jgi:hypothetical protein
MREKAGISWIATRLLSFSCSVLRAYYWEEETAMRLFSPFFFSLICVLKSLYIFADAARIDPQYLETGTRKSASEKLKGMRLGLLHVHWPDQFCRDFRPIG